MKPFYGLKFIIEKNSKIYEQKTFIFKFNKRFITDFKTKTQNLLKFRWYDKVTEAKYQWMH